jgi:hypothetical protein
VINLNEMSANKPMPTFLKSGAGGGLMGTSSIHEFSERSNDLKFKNKFTE